MLIENKNFIVTGGSDGLGLAICKNLVAKGANVAVISRKIYDERNSQSKTKFFQCDITDSNQVENTIESIINEFKTIDGLINCAGIWQKTNKFEEISLKEISEVISVNLTGLIFVTNKVLPYLKERKESSLVNIASKSGTRPMDLQTVYCASKYGVKGFTDTLKLELKGSAVKVLGFYPSGMNTKMFEKAGEEFPADNFMNIDEIAEIISFAIERPGNISLEEIQVEKY